MDKAEFQKKFAELQSEGRSKLEEISKKHDGELTLTDEYFKKMDEVREEYNKNFLNWTNNTKINNEEAKKLGLIIMTL